MAKKYENHKLKAYFKKYINTMDVDKRFKPYLVDILMRRAKQYDLSPEEIRTDVMTLIGSLDSIEIISANDPIMENAWGLYAPDQRKIYLSDDCARNKNNSNEMIYQTLAHEVYHALSCDPYTRADRLSGYNRYTGQQNRSLLETIVEKASFKTVFDTGRIENAYYNHNARVDGLVSSGQRADLFSSSGPVCEGLRKLFNAGSSKEILVVVHHVRGNLERNAVQLLTLVRHAQIGIGEVLSLQRGVLKDISDRTQIAVVPVIVIDIQKDQVSRFLRGKGSLQHIAERCCSGHVDEHFILTFIELGDQSLQGFTVAAGPAVPEDNRRLSAFSGSTDSSQANQHGQREHHSQKLFHTKNPPLQSIDQRRPTGSDVALFIASPSGSSSEEFCMIDSDFCLLFHVDVLSGLL